MSIKRYRIKIAKFFETGETLPREDLKDLIGVLVLAGYAVYNAEDHIVFETGWSDEVEEIGDD